MITTAISRILVIAIVALPFYGAFKVLIEIGIASQDNIIIILLCVNLIATGMGPIKRDVK